MRFGLTGGFAGVILGAVAVMSPAAHAQRVISDYEASKLTFDALTSVPAVHHVSYHRPTHVSSRHAAVHEATFSRHGLVHQVVYHPHAASRATAAHHGTSHRHHT